MFVSVSLPRLGGWRVLSFGAIVGEDEVSVSLPRLGGWRAVVQTDNGLNFAVFQSRCRDWVVGERIRNQ